MMKDEGKTIIVGGGVIGGGIAFELALSGIRCEIFEKGAFFSEASSATAGLLGAQSVRFFADSPAGPDVDFAWESFKIHREWTELIEEVSGSSVQFQREGILRLAFTEEGKKDILHRLNQTSLRAQWLSNSEVHKLEPNVSAVEGGVLFPEDAQLLPASLSQSLRKALDKLDVAVHSNTEVQELLQEKDRITGIRTVEGEVIHADTIILAAGAWTGKLLKSMGKNIPFIPVRGQCIAVKPPEPLLKRTVQTNDLYMLPRLDGTITIGASHLHKGFDKSPTSGELQQLLELSSMILPSLDEAEFLATWVGLRPSTSDDLPVIGSFPDVKGLIIAAGHYSAGVIMAPLTARIVSNLLKGEQPLLDMDPFRPDRNSLSETGFNGEGFSS